MIIRTDAVVLRGMDYGETSRIVTLLTRERGKVSVMARGARLPGSRYGSTLQPMAYVEVVLYYRPTRGLQTLTESAHLQRFPGIGADLEKLAIGLQMVELTEALMQEEQQLPPVLDLLLAGLQRLDRAGERSANVWPFFRLRLAGLLGFAPSFERETVAALPDEGGVLDPASGAILPRPAPGITASRAALRAFAILARADLDAVMRLRLTDDVRREVDRLVEAFLRYHFDDVYPSRSARVVGRLLDERDGPAS
ncbi:MAG: DNA repair protein RecO [Bacteroidetes bacterium]|nr:MAG: DNA repair protein RecO [Bacteroidota bacterium]